MTIIKPARQRSVECTDSHPLAGNENDGIIKCKCDANNQIPLSTDQNKADPQCAIDARSITLTMSNSAEKNVSPVIKISEKENSEITNVKINEDILISIGYRYCSVKELDKHH